MMSSNNQDKLVIAISSRALFDLTESHQIFESQGLDAYRDFQIEHEDTPLAPGQAFHLVEKILAINKFFPDETKVEVILISRNSSDTGLRIFHSIEHYGLPIVRAVFSSGNSPYKYIASFGAHLFLSNHQEDVQRSLNEGCAAATILPSCLQQPATTSDNILRIAFDGDAVLFSADSEHLYQQEGLKVFALTEKAKAKQPLAGGPFKPFLLALHQLQSYFPENNSPIRTALVTARAAPAHERVVRTLRSWGIRIDESFFLGGLEKTEFLRAFAADIFFDDQEQHCFSAAEHISTGHVPPGMPVESHSQH